MDKKILYIDDLVRKIEALKKQSKIIVQTHGVFDIIHPGIIRHLQEAKKQGDILIATVIKDKDVRKGPGRPIFPEELRAENVASIISVDYVVIVDDNIPFECVKKIKPDVFAKSANYSQKDNGIHKKIFEEERELYFGKCKILEINDISFSSTSIINNFLDIYPTETKDFLTNFSEKYSFKEISEKIMSLYDLKVLLLGDGIIDEYFYCESMGKSPKAQLIVHKYIDHEIFPGGVFAIANHLAGICKSVHMVSLLGQVESREDFIFDSLKPNVKAKFFYRNDGPTIIKRRYINQYQKQKTFEINYINDSYVDETVQSGIISYLESVIEDYDLILISDFGHGLISPEIIRLVESYSKMLAVNTQTNGANYGYNLITKYNRINFICLDANEARLATQEKYASIEDVARMILKSINASHLIITLGSDGSICVGQDGVLNHTPALSSKVLDIIGAGDAFFSYTAPCFAMDMPVDLVSFIGNTVGALAVQIVGNKRAVERHEVLEFMHAVLQ